MATPLLPLMVALLLPSCHPAADSSSGSGNAASVQPAGSGNPQPAANAPDPNAHPHERGDLWQISLAYVGYYNNNDHHAPSKPEELYSVMEGPQSPASKGIADGKYVVFWGADLQKIVKAGAESETILAYEKDTPTSGGLVAMADSHTVKGMTAAEFQKAPKAGSLGANASSPTPSATTPTTQKITTPTGR
ncbi:MAG: hypothetical protein JO112_05700 [Planctomycetes bacterium]|nr:hypothetical protein [Planctomycetota bacterium]